MLSNSSYWLRSLLRPPNGCFSSNEHRWPWYEPTTFLFNQYPFHDVHFNNCPGKWMSPQSFEQMSFQAFWLFIYLLFDLLSPPRKDADNLKQEAINDASSRNQMKVLVLPAVLAIYTLLQIIKQGHTCTYIRIFLCVLNVKSDKSYFKCHRYALD